MKDMYTKEEVRRKNINGKKEEYMTNTRGELVKRRRAIFSTYNQRSQVYLNMEVITWFVMAV